MQSERSHRHYGGLSITAYAPTAGPALLEGASLFLDFDGTLAGFTTDPEATRLGPGRLETLVALHERLEGRLAIVSGRALASLEARIADARITLVGSHGLEARIEGVREAWTERPAALDDAVTALQDVAASRGLLFEEKPFGAALHWREWPQRGAGAAAAVERIATEYGLAFQSGDHVAELRVAGGDKGDALVRLMRREPFAQGTPVMVGDDLTDEHGFAAAQALGGHGVLVGSRDESRARHRLAGVDAVWEWLG